MKEIATLALFLLAVFGVATAIAVLKIGQFFFGIGHCTKAECKVTGHPNELRKGLGRIPYLGDLFYCPPCLAFWFGAAASLWFLSPGAALGVAPGWKAAVVDGLAASAVAWILHVSVMWKVKDIPEI